MTTPTKLAVSHGFWCVLSIACAVAMAGFWSGLAAGFALASVSDGFNEYRAHLRAQIHEHEKIQIASAAYAKGRGE